MIQIFSSIILIGFLSFVNRLRGSDDKWFKPLAWLPISVRIKATILFGLAIMIFANMVGVVSPISIDSLVIKGHDLVLFFMSGVGFLIWAAPGWGQYMDSGSWQRRTPTKSQIRFIDSIINFYAKQFPSMFISTEEWDATKWNTLHRNSDVLGMTLRCTIFAVPFFVILAVYFKVYSIIALSLCFIPSGLIYLYWINESLSDDKSWYKKDMLGYAEWTLGAVCWGLSVVLMFYLV